MKHFLLSAFVALFAFAGVVPEADAQRQLGGGGSFGMQRQVTPPAQRPPAAAPQTTPRQQPATAGKRSWLGPVAGLAAGLGLAALFSSLGIGEEMGSLLLILLLVGVGVMLFRALTRRSTAHAAQGMQYAANGPTAQPAQAYSPAPSPAAFGGAAVANHASIPADFDAEGFARQAKVQFIRLQESHDAGNLDDIRQFTTPEVFAEIRMQLSERTVSAQRTDIVELNAEVIDVAEEAQRYIVSVRFSGLIRETLDSAPQPFDEIWHLVKAKDGQQGWVIAGIQQTH